MVFHSPCSDNPAAGGTTITVRNDLLCDFQNVGPSSHVQVMPGRLYYDELDGASETLRIINVHIVPSLSVEGKKAVIDAIIHLVADPDDMTCIIGEDFNFISEDNDMINLRTGTRYGKADSIGKYWNRKAVLLTEHYQDSMKQSIDHKYGDHLAHKFMRYQHWVSVSGFIEDYKGRPSYHLPVCSSLFARTRRPFPTIPRWLGSRPEFRKALQERLQRADLNCNPRTALRDCKSLMHEVAKKVKHILKEPDDSNPCSISHWALMAVCAVEDGDMMRLKGAAQKCRHVWDTAIHEACPPAKFSAGENHCDEQLFMSASTLSLLTNLLKAQPKKTISSESEEPQASASTHRTGRNSGSQRCATLWQEASKRAGLCVVLDQDGRLSH